MTTAADEVTVLDITEKQKVSYCIPTWLRDEQIRLAIGRVKARVTPATAVREDRIAIACYGPSLNDTWERLRDFQYIMTCSGAHKFLVGKGIIPTWHIDVDPRAHKADLIGTPQKGTEYLMASTCHPRVFDLLDGYNVKLWHIFDTAEEGMRILPEGEWALTGGCGAGLRAMVMARFLGFVDLHIFGMDGSEGPTGKHASDHPSQAPASSVTTYQGQEYRTTPAFLEAARQTFSELDKLPGVRATFYGEGLVQAMARDYTPKPVAKAENIAFNKPELISAEYRALNAQLHREQLAFGANAGQHAQTVLDIVAKSGCQSVLDYGCGKGFLAKAIPFPIWEYDPAIPAKAEPPRPADLVVCTDVLEHVEPDKLKFVLADLCRCTLKVGYFVVHTGPAKKLYPNGRNAHLIQRDAAWWEKQLRTFFTVASRHVVGAHVYFVVGPYEPLRLSFETLGMTAHPYLIGAAQGVLSPGWYRQLSTSFPKRAAFKSFGSPAKKLSLSEVNNPEDYARVVAGEPWRSLYRYVKRQEFPEEVFAVLDAHGVQARTDGTHTARFEFSRLPAQGGCLLPHTDLPSKVVTLVLALRAEQDAWGEAWGGGTDILKPKNGKRLDGQDHKCSLSDFKVVRTYDYRANQCVVFVKAPHSWHSVGPIAGPETDVMRKTVTINIERHG